MPRWGVELAGEPCVMLRKTSMVRKTELCNAKTFLQDDLRRTESSVGYLGEKGKKGTLTSLAGRWTCEMSAHCLRTISQWCLLKSSQIKIYTMKHKTYVEGRDDVNATTLNPVLLPVRVDGLRKSN